MLDEGGFGRGQTMPAFGGCDTDAVPIYAPALGPLGQRQPTGTIMVVRVSQQMKHEIIPTGDGSAARHIFIGESPCCSAKFSNPVCRNTRI